MYADESMRWDSAVEKRPHFAFHEKRNGTVALLMIGKEGFEVFYNGLIQRTILGVTRRVDGFLFADNAEIAGVRIRFHIIRNVSFYAGHFEISERFQNEPLFVSNEQTAIWAGLFLITTAAQYNGRFTCLAADRLIIR